MSETVSRPLVWEFRPSQRKSLITLFRNRGPSNECLVQKNAEDVKGGANLYFTPRSSIQAIVDVMKPKAGSEPKERFVICDPACGTGGFLLAAHEFIPRQKLDKAQLRYSNAEQLCGVELVDGVASRIERPLSVPTLHADGEPYP